VTARALPNLGSKKTPNSKVERLSTCKLCPSGVFSDQPYMWLTGRCIGYAHVWCVEAAKRSGQVAS
jgi:hypothetical protein